MAMPIGPWQTAQACALAFPVLGSPPIACAASIPAVAINTLKKIFEMVFTTQILPAENKRDQTVPLVSEHHQQSVFLFFADIRDSVNRTRKVVGDQH